MMFRTTAPLIAIALLLVGASACSSGSSDTSSSTATPPYAPTIVPSDFTTEITNQYFPLIPGTTFVYEGTVDGAPERDEATVTSDTKMILGVKCVVVHDVVTSNGELREDTYDWYAQDSEGNVWYFGEDTKEYENGKVKSTEGSWESGVDGALPGIIIKASPQVGDSYRQEYSAGVAEDQARVLRLNESKTVPAGSYSNVVVTEELTPLEPDIREEKYYAPGVGEIYETVTKGGSEESSLVSIRTQ